MSFTKWLLRLLAPAAEAQRREMREYRSCARAHAEDFNRTLSLDAERMKDVLRQARQKGIDKDGS